MDDTVTYEFGSRILCSGTDCGELRQLIVEPAASRVTDLVVQSPADGRHRVPIRFARPDGPDIRLDCHREELVAFPAPVVRHRSTALGSGDRVRALAGDAGHVEGVAVRSGSGEIVQVLVAAGPWWHRRHVAVPAAVVPGLGPEGIRVLMSKKQVKNLGSVAMRQGPRPLGSGHSGITPSITHP